MKTYHTRSNKVTNNVQTRRQTMNTMQQTTMIQGDKHVKTNRQAAVFVGIMFILATVSAILGLLFYQPILTGPDYLINGAAHQDQVILGALMELILVVTAIGTAIGLFPVLKPYGDRIALGHLFFRFLEAVVITVGIVAILSLSTLSENYVAAPAPDDAAFDAVGSLLHAVYKWTSMLGPLFFLGINTFMYSSLLYKSKLVPRPLALYGLISAALVFGAALVVLSGVATQLSTPVLLMIMPIAVFEMVFAGWLIVKGFNPSALASTSAKTETRTLLNAA
jgi:hypothetical protein